MSVTPAVVGRQAIVDRSHMTVGYELLFRAVETSDRAFDPASSSRPDGDHMTISVLFGALGIGLKRLTGGKTVFCNADRGVLTGAVPIALPPALTVIEVLEGITIDDEVLAGCRRLKRLGYRLAADDFRWFSGAERLLELVDIVKLDLRLSARDEVSALAQRCRPFGPLLLAEKVETAEELAWTRDAGFDLFQGYHLARPNTIVGNSLAATSLGIAQLTTLALRDDVTYGELEQVIRTDPALTYQLLQLASIGRLGETKRPVGSIRDALVLMGIERLRGWIPALTLRPAGLAADSRLPTVLARARTVELLTAQQRPDDVGRAFTAALVSGFGLLLNVPKSALVESLDLPDQIREDAFGTRSPIARIIRDVTEFENSRPQTAGPSTCDPGQLVYAAASAFTWAVDAIGIIDAA